MIPGFGSIPGMGSDSSVTKFTLKSIDEGTEVAFAFNPSKMTLDRKVSWANEGAQSTYGALFFSKGEADTLKFDALLDETESEASLLPVMEQLYAFSTPTVDDQRGEGALRPELLLMTWKEFKFHGVVENISFAFEMFSAAGDPKRVTVSLTLKGRSFVTSVTTAEFFDESQAG